MRLSGTYRFYSNGVLVGEQKNLLTTKGRQHILRYFSGQSQRFAEGIALGVGNSAATLSDDSLEMEIVRAPISVVSPDYEESNLVFKATVPAEYMGTFKEAGLVSQFVNTYSGNYASRMLVGFDPSLEPWPVDAVFSGTNARVGTEALTVSATATNTNSVKLEGLLVDLLGYSNLDAIKISYFVGNNVDEIGVRFLTTDSDYYEYTTTPDAGYNINVFNKSDMAAVGSPSWSTIVGFEFVVTATSGGSASVDFDAVRIEDTDSLNPDYFLISRTVLATPVVKSEPVDLDVEYTLELSFE